MLNYNDICVDTDSRRVCKQRSVVSLTRLEYRLLVTFLEHTGQPLSRGLLLALVWNTDAALQTRTVDVYVGKLRRKLGLERSLVTVQEVGYLLRK